ncbi:MAG: PLP-dependent aminotransferase family protein [candidate division Zixibacteria bacterium]|nr:PLP-dependent aminotransferase family protein [candidate division Zixibacteria bacterium]
MNWIFSVRAQEMKSSAIREILKITEKPDVISFAGGLPAPELFPIKQLKKACEKVLDNYGPKALQYSLTSGVLPLRQILAERLSQKGMTLTEDNIFITGGSQQGLDLAGRVFLDNRSVIICESPTYLGAIQAFNAYNPQYVTVDMDKEGMIVEQLEENIKKYKPRFIYVVSNFQNPSGATLSLKRRKDLIGLAKEYYIPIIDDNPYGELRYVGEDVPSLKSLGGDLVIELGTCSKIVSPGLRIGWVAASTEVMTMFERMKQGADLHTNTFAQYVLYEYIKAGNLDRHIQEIKVAYSERRDVMIEALKEHFPENVTWVEPKGGLFLWVELPQEISATKLLDEAVKQKVAYVPGKPFYPYEDKDNTLRLNFSNASPDMIREGIKRLGKVFQENVKILNLKKEKTQQRVG